MVQRERLLITVGVVLFVAGLLVGLSGTVSGMIRAFHEAQSTGQSTSLAEDVSQSLWTTFVLMPVIVLGFLLMIVGFLLRYFGKPHRPEDFSGKE